MRLIDVVVTNYFSLDKEKLTPGILRDIRGAFTYKNPEHYVARNSGIPHYALPPKTIVSYAESADVIVLPRGVSKRLRGILGKHGLSPVFIDNRLILPVIDIQANLPDDKNVREYQNKAIRSAIHGQYGVIVSPCGSGKTFMAALVVAELKQPTCILVHTLDLLSEWMKTFKECTSGGFTLGQFGGGKKQICDITIATPQTLYRLDEEGWANFTSKFGCVILDEAHHCPARMFSYVINNFEAKFRFGVTATPKRPDGKHFLLDDVIGSVLFNIDQKTLADLGFMKQCKVQFIATDSFNSHTDVENKFVSRTLMVSSLCKDKVRNETIADNIANSVMNGYFPIVLSDRVWHCHELASLVSRRGLNPRVLEGAVHKRDRETIRDQCTQGLVDVLIGTKVADEGLNIPNLNCIHLASPTGNLSMVEQRIGRTRRKDVSDKKALIYDYVDIRFKQCYNSYEKRLGLYTRSGFEILPHDVPNQFIDPAELDGPFSGKQSHSFES